MHIGTKDSFSSRAFTIFHEERSSSPWGSERSRAWRTSPPDRTIGAWRIIEDDPPSGPLNNIRLPKPYWWWWWWWWLLLLVVVVHKHRNEPSLLTGYWGGWSYPHELVGTLIGPWLLGGAARQCPRVKREHWKEMKSERVHCALCKLVCLWDVKISVQDSNWFYKLYPFSHIFPKSWGHRDASS